MGDKRRRQLSAEGSGGQSARGAFDGSIRPFANRLFRFGLSEFSIVVLLASAWISPQFVEALRPGFIAGLPMLFVAEFVFGHASAGMSVIAKFEGLVRWIFGLFLTLIYAVWFVLLFTVGHGIQAALFLWITIGRIYRADADFRQAGTRDGNRDRLAARLAIPALLRVAWLMLCVGLATIIPLPSFGLAGYAGPTMGSGSFVYHPESVVFTLLLHFAAIPWLERNAFPAVARRLAF